ncbi:hypothetical protein ATANTOWER_013326 [Ataeniobius toweri]|uniref:Uncharacterized protein n=1 Tax=Ataeniobius toweri TaxID=208326 RepID=A0ABU7B8N8_9TELE|nr:hypothetical protein [Ataeniobius toweri]
MADNVKTLAQLKEWMVKKLFKHAGMKDIQKLKLNPEPLSNKTLSVVGVSGTPQTQALTVPWAVKDEGQTLTHQYLYSLDCPGQLCGKDLANQCWDPAMDFNIKLRYELFWNFSK